MTHSATQPDVPGSAAPPCGRSSLLAGCSGVRHGFFGRRGGVSSGLFASLNCGPGSGDAPEHVAANRARAAAALDVEPDRLVTLYQIHSAEAVTVSRPWTRAQAPRADAMATHEPGLALGILTADCAPVLFADPEAGVAGAAHAGWRGALSGVLESAILAMEKLGARRGHIRAAVGPCIGQPNYEVGPEFRERFLQAAEDNGRFFTPSTRADHWRFNLPGYTAARLAAAGVSAEVTGECTYADEAAYFSYRRATHRREPDYGRNLSAIALSDREPRHA
ncbi:MAG: peptidoglycan editing factor PgeF [Alphaproteobacteria bacterium]